MRRSDWSDLPDAVQAAIQRHTGPVRGSDPAEAGKHSDITAALHTDEGRVFIKGMQTEPVVPDLWALRRESRIYPYVTEYAPRLLWTVDAGGWLVLGFEHIEGRHADFTPGSPDLAVLAQIVEAFEAMPCPGVVTRCVERRWQDYVDDVTPMAGDAMLHVDLNPANLLVTSDGRVYVIDWGFTSRGASWVELAILVQWLIGNGHTPRQAEEWVGRFPSWRAADSAAIDLLAHANAARWRDLTAAYDSPPWAVALTSWVEQWASYRKVATP